MPQKANNNMVVKKKKIGLIVGSGELAKYCMEQLILLGYEFMNSGNDRWDYFVWVCHLGSENYSGDYHNLNSQCKEDIEEAGYDYKKLADNVSAMCKAGILAAHPEKDIDGSHTGTNSALKKRIRRPAEKPLAFPTIKNKNEKEVR